MSKKLSSLEWLKSKICCSFFFQRSGNDQQNQEGDLSESKDLTKDKKLKKNLQQDFSEKQINSTKNNGNNQVNFENNSKIKTDNYRQQMMKSLNYQQKSFTDKKTKQEQQSFLYKISTGNNPEISIGQKSKNQNSAKINKIQSQQNVQRQTHAHNEEESQINRSEGLENESEQIISRNFSQNSSIEQSLDRNFSRLTNFSSQSRQNDSNRQGELNRLDREEDQESEVSELLRLESECSDLSRDLIRSQESELSRMIPGVMKRTRSQTQISIIYSQRQKRRKSSIAVTVDAKQRFSHHWQKNFIPNPSFKNRIISCDLCQDLKADTVTDCQHYYHLLCIYDFYRIHQSCRTCQTNKGNPMKFWCMKCLISFRSFDTFAVEKEEIYQMLENPFCLQCSNI